MSRQLSFAYYLLGAGELPQGQCGPKARNLHRLRQAGFQAPKGIILPFETVARLSALASLHPDDSLSQLVQKLTAAPGLMPWLEHLIGALQPFHTLILRTSAEGEDHHRHALAGLYASVPGIANASQLASAIAACWLKAQETGRLQPEGGRLSFLLQEYVEADYAGVAFTVSPVRPVEQEILIELAQGNCETLTGGRRVDARLVYDWRAERIIMEENTSGLLPPEEQLLQLGRLLLQVQEHFGSPQDVEWAMAGGGIYLLQSRPITRIFFPAEYIWTNANFRDGGIGAQMPSPLMWSLYSFTFNRSIEAFAYRYHLRPEPMPSAWSTTFLGYPYWNLSATKSGASKVLGYVERQFDEGQGVNPYYEGDGHVARFSFRRLLTSLKALASIQRSIRSRFEECRKTKDYFYRVVLTEFRAFPFAESGSRALGEYFGRLANQHLLYIYSNYWNIIYDNTFVSTFAQNALSRYNRRNRQNIPYSALTAGIEDIAHIRPMLHLWEIAAGIRQDPEALAFWAGAGEAELAESYRAGRSFPFREALGRFLDEYGYKSDFELEILSPNWVESPEMPILAIRQYLREGQAPLKGQLARQRESYMQLRASLRSPALVRKMERQRKLLWWKEEIRDITTHLYHLIRQTALELGRKLSDERVLGRPDDVFFLDFSDLIGLAAGGDSARRRDQVEYNRRLRRSFRHFAKPDIIFPSSTPVLQPVPKGQAAFQGIGVCPGLARGRALVIPNLDGEKPPGLAAGSILVTDYINPSHIPFFSGLKAIVTANGGLLSHAAIMCREFGIPAVFGVPNLLPGLETGRMLEVDGSSGQVKYL